MKIDITNGCDNCVFCRPNENPFDDHDDGLVCVWFGERLTTEIKNVSWGIAIKTKRCSSCRKEFTKGEIEIELRGE